RPRPARPGAGGEAGNGHRPGSAPAARRQLAAAALAAPAPTRLAPAVHPTGHADGGGERRPGLEGRPAGPVPAAAAAGLAAAGADLGPARRLHLRIRPGGGARRLAGPALALCRGTQAAGGEAQPLAAGPLARHGHAVAGHRRRQRLRHAAAGALPATGRRPGPARPAGAGHGRAACRPGYSRQNAGVSSTSSENTSRRPRIMPRVPSQTAASLAVPKVVDTSPKPGPRLARVATAAP